MINQDIKFKGKEVRLLSINPRYTDMEKVKFKNLNFNKYNLKETARKLMQYEGDLKDFLELIKSINENGFKSINDKILVHFDKNEKYYYCVEGNRRLLAINLFLKNLEFRDLFKDKPFYENTTDLKVWNKNKEEITLILKENKISEKLINDMGNYFYDISEDKEEDIWNTIFMKHAGEQTGQRIWSRAKYFNDLLTLFKNYKKIGNSNSKCYAKLSKLFGKKEDIIKRDINSAIWIINSINKYNNHNTNKIDINEMEISGYELVLSQKLDINGESISLRKALNISIDVDKQKINYDLSDEKFLDIISFLIINSINKNITTRGIKEEIYDKFSDITGYALYNKKTLNSQFNELKKNINRKPEENIKYLFLKEIKEFTINPNKFENNEYDSYFIKGIKYNIRNDLKMICNLHNYWENEFPYTVIAAVIRNTMDLLVLEMITRIENFANKIQENEFLKNSDENNKSISSLNSFLIKFKKNDHTYNVSNLTQIITEILSAEKSIFNFPKFISNEIDNKYSKRLKELKIDWKDSVIESDIYDLLDYRRSKNKNNANYGLGLLNTLIHKPYYELLNNNSERIENLNKMFKLMKSIIKLLKIQKD